MGYGGFGGVDVQRQQGFAQRVSAFGRQLAQLLLALRQRALRHLDVLDRGGVVGMVFSQKQLVEVFLALGDGGFGYLYTLARVRYGGGVRVGSLMQLVQVFQRLIHFAFGEGYLGVLVSHFLRRGRVVHLLAVFDCGVYLRPRRDDCGFVLRQFRGVHVQIRQRLARVFQLILGAV